MPSTLLRLAVALLTFGLGVSATTFWIAYRTPNVRSKPDMRYRKTVPRHSCPMSSQVKADAVKVLPLAPENKCDELITGYSNAGTWGDLAKCLRESQRVQQRQHRRILSR